MKDGRSALLSKNDDRWVLPPETLWPFVAGAATASLVWYVGTFWWWRNGREEEKSNNTDDDMSLPTNLQYIIMSSVDDLTSRIGELPHRIRRTRWPWQTLRRNKSSDTLEEEEDDDGLLGSESNNSTASTLDPEDKSGFCIGSIFGLDVGGTLAKLVYFEEVKNGNSNNNNTSSGGNHEGTDGTSTNGHTPRHSRHFSYAGDALSEADLQSLHALAPVDGNRRNSSSNLEALKHRPTDELEQNKVKPQRRRTHSDELPTSKKSTDNLAELHPAPQKTKLPNGGTAPDTAGRAISDNTASMPKVHSMFDFQFTIRDREEALDRFYNFAKHLGDYTRDGVRDHKLRFYSRELGGYFHFIHFETRRMREAMDLIRKRYF